MEMVAFGGSFRLEKDRKWDVLLVAAAAGIALAVFMSVLAVKTARE